MQAAADEQKILEKLSSVCSADSGLFVLSDLLNSAARQSMTFGAEHKLYSAQKKGNVLYLQDRVTFRNARIYYGDKLSEMARSDPRPSVQITRGAGSGQRLASVLQEGRENANIDAGLGFIWRISVKPLTSNGLPISRRMTTHNR